MKGFILLLTLVFVAYSCSVETGYTSDDAQGEVTAKKKKRLKKNRNSSDQDEVTNGEDDKKVEKKKSKKKKKSSEEEEEEVVEEEVVEEEVVEEPPVDLTIRGPLKQDPVVANKWVLTIKDNHGVNPWNADTEEGLIRMKAGEILKIKFLDSSVNHQLHSSNNNGPCQHGGNRQYDANDQEVNFNATAAMGPGTSIECDIELNDGEADFRDGNANFYDHTNQGNNAGRKVFAHFGVNEVPAWVAPADR